MSSNTETQTKNKLKTLLEGITDENQKKIIISILNLERQKISDTQKVVQIKNIIDAINK